MSTLDTSGSQAEVYSIDRRYLLAQMELIFDILSAALGTDSNLVDLEQAGGPYITAEKAKAIAATERMRSYSLTARSEELIRQSQQIEAEAQLAGTPLAIERLALATGMSETELEIVLVGVAAELDDRFERIFGYLNDNLHHNYPSLALVAKLWGYDPISAEFRQALSSHGAIFQHHLGEIVWADQPFLSRGLKIYDAVVNFLLGNPAIDSDLVGVLTEPELSATAIDGLGAAAAKAGAPCYVQGSDPSRVASQICKSLIDVSWTPFFYDLRKAVAKRTDVVKQFDLLARDARLLGAAVVVGPIDLLGPEDIAHLDKLLDRGFPLVLFGMKEWPSLGYLMDPLLF